MLKSAFAITPSTVRVFAVCDFDGDEQHMDMDLTAEQFSVSLKAWRSGNLIQNAFPTLSSEEREFLMTGTSPQKWEEMFGK